MIEEYLQDRNVQRRNQAQETFPASRRVFIDLQQTPVPVSAQDTSLEGALSHTSLKAEFDAISARYAQLEKAKREAFESERR